MKTKNLLGMLMLFLLTGFFLSACCDNEKNNKITPEDMNN